MRTTFHNYALLLLITCSLCSCEVKKVAQENNSINYPVIELSEREQRLMQEKMHLDSLNETLQWKEIRDGLYINKNGELGFKTASFRPKIEFTEFYITDFGDDKKTPLKDVIDAKSFKCVVGDNGYGGYYKDKSRIFHFFGTSDGGNFYIVKEADYATFEVLEDCYVRDKNHIYDLRFRLMEDVDVATFKVISRNGSCLAKDKNGYYRRDRKLTEEQLAQPEIQKLKKKLDKL